MARKRSELTQAIFDLLDQTSGDLTHATALPLLKKRGVVAMAVQPERVSDELLAKWDTYQVDPNDPASIQATAKELGLDMKTAHAIMDYKTFKDEQNRFNVTKHKWTQLNGEGKTKEPKESKPKVKAKTKKPKLSKVTAKRGPKPKRGRPSKATVAASQTTAELAALEFIESHGGMAAVHDLIQEHQQQIANLQETLEDIQQKLELVGELQKRLKAAA